MPRSAPLPSLPTIALATLALIALAPSLGCAREATGPDVPVEIGDLGMDPTSGAFVVVLEEQGGVRRLPIWIGHSEARAIASELEHEVPLRPNTHDLAKRLVDRLDGALERVVVTELSEGIYYARIDLRAGGRRLAVDSRPSDAIALALRYGAPLFVREAVFEQSDEAERAPPRGDSRDRQVRHRSL